MNFETVSFGSSPTTSTDETSRAVTTHWCMAKIIRDPMEHALMKVRVHELPILEAVHGEGNVQRADNPPAPDDYHEVEPRAEYARLERHYGLYSKDQSFTEFVYGRYQEGRFVRELEALGAPPKRRTRAAKAPAEAHEVSTLGEHAT
ncbi:MAG: hypothetical protein ACR2RL_21710 [Gammaproteobacteria bacterium]